MRVLARALAAADEGDGLNRRVEKLLGSAPPDPASPTSYYDYYYNENWQVLEERKGGSTNPYAQYVWDARYIDAPVVRFHDSNTDGTLDDTLYYATDANMNVTALVDTSGTVQERYTYDAYGQVHISDGTWGTVSTDYANQILFGGYRYDPETGLYHVRNRMYQPTLGRWTRRDPMGHVDGLNDYEAMRGSPITRVDPQGLDSVDMPGFEWATQPTPQPLARLDRANQPCPDNTSSAPMPTTVAKPRRTPSILVYPDIWIDPLSPAERRYLDEVESLMQLRSALQGKPGLAQELRAVNFALDVLTGDTPIRSGVILGGTPAQVAFVNNALANAGANVPVTGTHELGTGPMTAVMLAAAIGGESFAETADAGESTAPKLLYHYTTADESSFANGLWENSSVTDKLYTNPVQPSQELGIPVPNKIIPIQDTGQFVPNTPPIVQPSFRFAGGGTDFINPQPVPPSQILPAMPIGGN